jgi:hypothetical protein
MQKTPNLKEMGLYNSTMAISGVYRWLKCKGIIFSIRLDI